MDTAWVRANQAVFISNLRELQLPSTPLVILVTSPGCEHCATFETEYTGIAEQQANQRHGTMKLMFWSCSTPERREAALNTGVTNVPCIVILPPAKNGVDLQIQDAFEFITP